MHPTPTPSLVVRVISSFTGLIKGLLIIHITLREVYLPPSPTLSVPVSCSRHISVFSSLKKRKIVFKLSFKFARILYYIQITIYIYIHLWSNGIFVCVVWVFTANSSLLYLYTVYIYIYSILYITVMSCCIVALTISPDYVQ